MSFFKRLSFHTFFQKDVIDNHFLDLQTEQILNEFNTEYRFKEVNELTYPNREIKTNLIYAATTLWTRVINASHSLYKKIQILEADYSDVKSQLDNKLDYELVEYERKHNSIQGEIKDCDAEIKEYKKQAKLIENKYNIVGDSKILKGSLSRIPHWVFWLVMIVAGGAELFIYKNVFMSQEIGLIADMPLENKIIYDAMALMMATGFTVMLIWLAHKLGELLRHYDSATQEEKFSYYIKGGFISLVVLAAIWATVVIRGDMHEILAKDKQIELLNEKFNDASPFESDDEESGFGNEEEDNEDEEDSGFGNEEDSPAKTIKITQDKRELLREEINKDKGDTAWLFTIINIFIVVGGIFLSYETHTSSRIYETIESHIKKLEKLKLKLERELESLDKSIIKFKTKKVDTLFNKLLLKAALYDKEVRTYNTYMQIFELKMQLIEDYIKKIYEEKGVKYDEIFFADVIGDKIVLDLRKELHHVNNIEEYMVYKYKDTKKETKNV